MHIVFYDGECGLCDRAVRFIIDHDRKKRFQFAPLQGETARHLLSPLPKALDTMVLLEEGKLEYVEGKAALRTLWLLGGIWSVLGLFYFITPRFVADAFYRFIAKRRHHFFSRESCKIQPGNSGRYLN